MEELYKWVDGAIANANGLSFMAGLICGFLWKRFAPAVRAFVAKTPTKLDDMVVTAADACAGADTDEREKFCAEELNKLLSNDTIVKLVQLRKAKLAADRAAASGKS